MKLVVSKRSSNNPGEESRPSADSWGGETDWSLIRKASAGSPEVERDRVWGELVHRYAAPVKRVLARHLSGDPNVEDATADFFSDLFQRRQILDRADPEQGRFRCYIQGVIRRYAWQWRRAHGAVGGADLDGVDVVHELESEVERDEELAWADAILEHALARLERFAASDTTLLRRFYGLFGTPRASGEDLARERTTSVATLHVALHRARIKLRSALVEELRPMVRTSEDMQQEIQFLITRLCSAHPGLDLAD